MAYSTQDDILKEISEKDLAQLTSEDDEVIDTDVVATAIANADSEIDGYVGVRYSLPLTSPPALIKKLSIKIALYNLFSRRSNRLGGMDETIKENYNNSVAMLKDISKGVLTLGIDPPPAAVSEGGASFKGEDREFTRDTLKGY